VKRSKIEQRPTDFDGIQSPTLFIVDGRVDTVIDLNREAYGKLNAEKHVSIVPGASNIYRMRNPKTSPANSRGANRITLHGSYLLNGVVVIDLSQQKHTAWETVLLELAKRPGVTMFIGASDTGKTACLRAAATHLAREGLLPFAIVDADIGQSTVGPPTTVGLTFVTKKNVSGLLSGRITCHAMHFVGALSPVGHLLQTIVATKRLVDQALRKCAKAVLVDTTGLIGGSVGFYLKFNKIELLKPRHIVTLQRGAELEDLLSLLADRRGLTVHRLAVSCEVRSRSPAERYFYRTSRFAAYFKGAKRIQLETGKLSILSSQMSLWKVTGESSSPVISPASFPSRNMVGCLVGLNDASNETLALGLLERVTRHGEKMELLTPVRRYKLVRIIQLANIRLAKTGEELAGRKPQAKSAEINSFWYI
jgi:polynucleotide 5'-hydroxyl-kinase GRC3/NOL9